MFCTKCGHKNPDDAVFCMKCGVTTQASAEGAPVPPPPMAPAPPATPPWQAPSPAANPAAWAAPPYNPAPTHAAAPSPVADPHSPASQGPLQPEQQVWMGAMSWKGLLNFGWILAFLIPLPLIIYSFSMRVQFGGYWGLSFLTLIPVVAFFVRLWMLRTTSYRITTERISVLKGILSRESDDLQLIRVADVQFFQPLLGRLLNVGDIRILSTDQTVPDLVIPGVQSPSEFKEMLWNLVRERRRNLVAMEQLNKGVFPQ